MRDNKYPAVDRSHFKPNSDDYSIDLAFAEGAFSDGRPFRIELWAASEVTYLTYFFSSKGIENLSEAQLKDYLMSEHVVEFKDEEFHSSGYSGINVSARKQLDASDNEIWEVTAIVGDEDRTYLNDSIALQRYWQEHPKTVSPAEESRTSEVELRMSKETAPLDSKLIQAGLDLAGFHIGGGARKFTEYSEKMLKDLGDMIKPYLKSFYLAVRNYPGFDNTGMNNEAQIDELEKQTVEESEKSSQKEHGMTISEMANLAKQHWLEYHPKGYKRLVRDGVLESEAEAAAKLTMREMQTLMKGGLSESQAWEAARELFILKDPMLDYNP